MKNFSPRAKEIVSVFAQDEARKLGSKQLLPEHVILAMIKNKEGLANQVFEKLLLEADALLDFIEKLSIHSILILVSLLSIFPFIW
ncbi:MAG: Clp protease N-terminal domain-containing protein, partial [Spirochaetaceae bacterium]|nr:Clp protease N-terminal domain-containing protein [Spirochaetaceae bacterium]